MSANGVEPSGVVVVTGSRDWPDPQFVIDKLREHLEITDTVITGGARGVDDIAHRAALAWGMSTMVVPANWEKYGKVAGHYRNYEMLSIIEWPRCVLAFQYHASPGTSDCVRQAYVLGLGVVRFTEADLLR